MTQADGIMVVAPMHLIIPTIGDKVLGSSCISGSIFLSGQRLVMWRGAWCTISGSYLG